jgi:hypothetical protein
VDLNGSGIDELDDIAHDLEMIQSGCNAYGVSKALTRCLPKDQGPRTKEHDDDGLMINAVTPGHYARRWCYESTLYGCHSANMAAHGHDGRPTGRYCGSDCQRSPYDVYRGPGDPVYKGSDGK